MVMSVAFLLFMGDGPSFLSKKRHFKNFTTFWFSELEDAGDMVLV
jgi:hypothetical protein